MGRRSLLFVGPFFCEPAQGRSCHSRGNCQAHDVVECSQTPFAPGCYEATRMAAARYAITRGLVLMAWALAACSSRSGCGDQASPADAGMGGFGATAKTAGDLAAAAKAGGSAPTCSGSPGGACTPTEQLFLQHDPSCYACLLKQGCIDDVTFNDRGNECGDLIGSTEAGGSREQACLDVVACTLTHSGAQPVINNGYCGTPDRPVVHAPEGAGRPVPRARAGRRRVDGPDGRSQALHRQDVRGRHGQ